MKAQITWCVVAALLGGSSILAIGVPGTDVSNHLSLQFKKERLPAGKRNLNRPKKRDSMVSDILTGDPGDMMYVIEVGVGTPPQQILMHVDTGSSDTWVPWSGSAICQLSESPENGGDADDLCATGSFNPDNSSTYTEIQLAPGGFNISYGDKTAVTGLYFTDTLDLGGANITNLTMGLGVTQQNAEEFQALMGIGFDTFETAYGMTANESTIYPNVVSQLKMQGFINTRAYSIWLDNHEDDTGTILFGGVDSSRYTGQLVVLPLQEDYVQGSEENFYITLNTMKITDGNNRTLYSANNSMIAFLDTGTTATWVPRDMANAIMAGFGVIEHDEMGLIVPCDLASRNATFDFQFGDAAGPIISVPLSAIVYPVSEEVFTFADGRRICRWGIAPNEDNEVDYMILGDTFLRSAYVVYNLDGHTVAIAQSNTDPPESDPVEIVETNSIPGATSTATGSVTITTISPVTNTPPPVVSGESNVPLPNGNGTFQVESTTQSGAPASSSASAAPGGRSESLPLFALLGGVLLALFGGALLFLR